MSANPISAQNTFARALLDPSLTVPEGMQGQSTKRYAIYRNNVTVGLVRALEANFPAIRKLLGEIYFAGLAREFAQAHPPQSPIMFFYGDQFAQFLERQSDLADYPYLPDVARLEQQWRVSYHEQDAPCLAPQEIAALGDEALDDLRLTPHPAFALLSSQFSVHSIFEANRTDDAAPAAAISVPEFVIISRPHFTVETSTISESTFVFLAALLAGETLGQAANDALAIDPDLNLADCIGTALATGAFQPLNIEGK